MSFITIGQAARISAQVAAAARAGHDFAADGGRHFHVQSFERYPNSDRERKAFVEAALDRVEQDTAGPTIPCQHQPQG